MIAIDNLSFTYKNGIRAVDDISAMIGPGLYLLLGENGAGKTTLMHLMSGLLYPIEGSVKINDSDVSLRMPSLYSDTIFVSESLAIPSRTIRDFADVHSPFYPNFNPERFTDYLKEFGMTGNEVLKNLSFGSRHKAILAYVLSLGCSTMLFDEPANGLDINSRKILRSMIGRTVDENSTCIVSTHTVSDFEALFDGVIIISHGKLILCETTEFIGSRLRFEVSPFPSPEALYYEMDLGQAHSIVPNFTPEESSVDFGLLYSGLLSPAGNNILSYLID